MRASSDYAAFIGSGVTTKLIKSIDKTTYETPHHPECNLDYAIGYLTMNGELTKLTCKK